MAASKADAEQTVVQMVKDMYILVRCARSFSNKSVVLSGTIPDVLLDSLFLDRSSSSIEIMSSNALLPCLPPSSSSIFKVAKNRRFKAMVVMN